MKKSFLFLIVVILTSLFVSCNQQPTPQKTITTVTTEKITYSNQGFYVEQQVIVKGNTVWGISEKVYGAGLQWQDIVALNPFLSTPNRLYYNPDRKMWIVKIYPGEVLNIGGQKVYPSCTYESTTTVTTSEPSKTVSAPIVPWWGWLLILGLVAFIVWLLFHRNRENSAVNINEMSDFDHDTRGIILKREQDRRDRMVNILHRDTKKGRIGRFLYNESDNSILIEAEYRDKQSKVEPGQK